MTSENSGVPAALPEGRFTGPGEFSNLIRQALRAAAVEGWREIILCDRDFADWPLGEQAVVQALNGWSKTGRKLILVARTYDAVPRRHARFVTWRQTWSHVVECRKTAATSADGMISALWSPGWVFERLDVQRSSGVAGFEVGRRTALRERLNEHLLNSSPAFPATVLGL